MPEIHDEARFSCSCGSVDVGSQYYHGEEYGMWKCNDCGCCDYPDAFDRPQGFIDDYCPTCKEETPHEIVGIDNWDGTARFACTTCHTKGNYKITSPRNFERDLKND